jgi:hypothetical protein
MSGPWLPRPLPHTPPWRSFQVQGNFRFPFGFWCESLVAMNGWLLLMWHSRVQSIVRVSEVRRIQPNGTRRTGRKRISCLRHNQEQNKQILTRAGPYQLLMLGLAENCDFQIWNTSFEQSACKTVLFPLDPCTSCSGSSSVYVENELRAGQPGFNSWQGQWWGIFFFTTSSRPALGPTKPPIQWAPGVKRPGGEADHSPPSSAEVKNEWSCISTPPIHLHGMVFS